MRSSSVLFLAASLLCACSSTDESVPSSADGGTGASADAGESDNSPDASVAGSACGTPLTLSRVDIMHDGRSRGALVHLPADYDGSPRPLVVNFHGRDTTASQERLISKMDSSADAAGYIVVYPEGISNSFNAGFCCGEAQSQNVDDVGFTQALLDELESVLCIDSDQIFATGLSNGGYLVQRIACETPERFAGFSSVAGLMAITSCTPSEHRPFLLFHGTGDQIVPYATSGFSLGAVDTMNGWAARNGCDATATNVYSQGDASCARYDNCPAGKQVELCTIADGGHTWPGGLPVPFLGKTSTDINANDHMWSFWH